MGLQVKSPSFSHFTTYLVSKMWSPVLMIQHLRFPEDRYLGALFEEQKVALSFMSAHPGCRKNSLSACLPGRFPNHQPPGCIGQRSFSLLPDETVTYVGEKK